jgi:predicted site-specific integrase-resolvase
MSNTMTPTELATELSIDPKTLRGWLRKEFTRDPAKKNTSWAIDKPTADAARARFAKKADA